MKRIAIAGGIGAGKSEATDYLSRLGYGVIDADEIAREVVEPGQPAWRALRDAFGDAVLHGDGTLDREFLAQVVFADPSALRRLNSITHVQIGLEILRALKSASTNVVFIALPLFQPEHRTAFELDEVWLVQASPDVALSRLLQYRGMNDEGARARLASQMSNDERAAIVDHVIWNDGTIDALHVKLKEQLRRSGIVDE
ncbi:MAG: dephospho-CoA kinase [Acidimicrobiales bacterium]